MPDAGASVRPPALRVSRMHVLIPTHTTRHLAACLASMAWQLRPPDSIVVSCDTDDPAIARLVEEWWPRLGAARAVHLPGLLLVMRPHQKEARLNQVRNNALRALDRASHLAERDIVIVLDGDTLLAPDGVLRHQELASLGFEAIIPYRVNLDQARTDLLGPEQLLQAISRGRDPVAGLATPRERQELAERHRRYLRHLRLKQTALPGLPKAHKPKILGGHHAVSVRCLRAVNGYDEQYTGYGYDDDDLSRRLHSLPAPPRIAIAVSEILAFHLWHPSRAPARPTDAPGFARFSRPGLPTVAEHGWKHPVRQPDPEVRTIAESPRQPVGHGTPAATSATTR